MKKVLIFGAGGFVGRYMAQEFIKHDYVVIGTDETECANFPDNMLFSKADILDSEAIEQLIIDTAPDMIINLAAVSSVGMSWKNPRKTISINVNGTLNIIESAIKCEKQPKILLIGSSEEYAASEQPINENYPLNANNPYGISKLTQERFAELYRERYGVKIYCVRAFNHTGVGQKDTFVLPSFCRQAAEIEKSGSPGIIAVGNLDVKRDFSDVRDIVKAYRMIIESEEYSKVYNIGSGKAYSLKELIEYIVSLCSREIEIRVEPTLLRPVDTPYICCDNRRISSDIGWFPDYSIYDTLREMYMHFLNI